MCIDIPGYNGCINFYIATVYCVGGTSLLFNTVQHMRVTYIFVCRRPNDCWYTWFVYNHKPV